MDTEKFVEFKNFLPVIESNFIKHFVGFGIENKDGEIIYKREYLNRPIDKWLLELINTFHKLCKQLKTEADSNLAKREKLDTYIELLSKALTETFDSLRLYGYQTRNGNFIEGDDTKEEHYLIQGKVFYYMLIAPSLEPGFVDKMTINQILFGYCCALYDFNKTLSDYKKEEPSNIDDTPGVSLNLSNRLALLDTLGIIGHLQEKYQLQHQPEKLAKLLALVLDVTGEKTKTLSATVKNLINNTDKSPKNETALKKITSELTRVGIIIH